MKVSEAIGMIFASTEEKRNLRRRLARRAAREAGYYIYSDHMVWKEQPFFEKAWTGATGIPGIADPRCFVLQSVIRSLARVKGDVAECGVRRGRSTYFMLTADEAERTYHLFDAFEGLPEPTEDDRLADGSVRWTEGDLSTEEAVARENLSGFSNVSFHVGWIPQTLTAVAGGSFALVHIDVDLHAPTRDSLEFFWPLVVPGGMVVSDDYGSRKCPGARKAFDEFFADKAGIIELPTGQALVRKAEA